MTPNLSVNTGRVPQTLNGSSQGKGGRLLRDSELPLGVDLRPLTNQAKHTSGQHPQGEQSWPE